MDQYTQPSQRARHRLLLAVLVWVFVVLILNWFETIFPLQEATHKNLVQVERRSLFALLLNIGLYLAMTAVVLALAVRTVRCKQWPPTGMEVPFRTRIRAIHRPSNVWLLVAVILVTFSLNIARSVKKFQDGEALITEIRSLIEASQNPRTDVDDNQRLEQTVRPSKGSKEKR